MSRQQFFWFPENIVLFNIQIKCFIYQQFYFQYLNNLESKFFVLLFLYRLIHYKNNVTLDSIRAIDLDQGEEEEEGEAGKSGLNLINK